MPIKFGDNRKIKFVGTNASKTATWKPREKSSPLFISDIFAGQILSKNIRGEISCACMFGRHFFSRQSTGPCSCTIREGMGQSGIREEMRQDGASVVVTSLPASLGAAC